MSAFVSLSPPKFGRLNFWAVVAVHGICGYGMIVGDHWAAYTFCGAVILALWIGGYIDWRNLQKIDHKHPNAHRKDICEGCVPVCYAHDGSPIRSIVLWYAATRGHTEIDAQHILSQVAPDRLEELFDEHDDYLKHPKFDKFRNYPRP